MMEEFIKQAADVKPSRRQLAWFELGYYAFVHFGMNTFTDREWGTGDEEESLFNPKKLDCEQWAEVFKCAGMKGMILTVKHHDGFCLWPSAYTEHSVKNSPIGRDIVKEAGEACRKKGMKFGIYLSPWDRNSRYYGTEEYNDYYCGQLTELLTGYGELFCIWLDGACGEGANGKKQQYDFGRYIQLIRKYQPEAVIFYDHGPDVRWCGNEAGKPRHSEWAVVPGELCYYSDVQTGPGPFAGQGDLSCLYNTEAELGSMSSILYSKGLVFAPAEINTSIRPGWFWHEKEEPRAVEELFSVYINSVGGNACLNLNVPPNREGLIDERDVERLGQLREMIDFEFGHQLPVQVSRLPESYPMQPKYLIKFKEPVRGLKYLELREDIARGQRVESFRVEASPVSGNRFLLFQGTTVGNRKICPLADSFGQRNPFFDSQAQMIESLVVSVAAARGEVFLKDIKVYGFETA